MSACVLPNVKSVKDLFDGLLGDGTSVKTVAAPPRRTEPLVVADYQDDAGVVQSRLICDLNLANAAGAALSMIPAVVAHEAVKKQEIPEAILVNLHEVLNICVNVFARETQQHLKLARVAILQPGQPDFPTTLCAKVAAFDVQIPRYGQGALIAESLST